MRKDVAALAAAFGVADAVVVEVEVVELDVLLLQAVATSPRLSVAVTIAARCRGPTVLPLLEGPCPPWSAGYSRSNGEARSGGQALRLTAGAGLLALAHAETSASSAPPSSPPGHTLIHGPARVPVQGYGRSARGISAAEQDAAGRSSRCPGQVEDEVPALLAEPDLAAPDVDQGHPAPEPARLVVVEPAAAVLDADAPDAGALPGQHFRCIRRAARCSVSTRAPLRKRERGLRERPGLPGGTVASPGRAPAEWGVFYRWMPV